MTKTNSPVGALDLKKQESLKEEFQSERANRVLSNALARNGISDVIYDPSSLKEVNPVFSLEVKTMPAANQKASGRCWIFAGLNVLREIVGKKLKLKEFELSQNYIALYDKIEKANFALESILSLSDRDHDDRVLSFILMDPVSDGGQWDMFVNLVKKYGIMPKAAFPETFQSENTRQSDFLVNCRIRRFAAEAHALIAEGKEEEARLAKDKAMKDIYNLFIACFGLPPKSFDFAYEDSDKKYRLLKGMTPQSFFKKYVGDDIDFYQSLINSPTKDKPFGKNFTIDYLGNVIEGKPINHLNVTMDRMKEAILAQLKDGEPVWFGSDVSFYSDRDGYAWDDKHYDYESAFGFAPEFDKENMLDFRGSAMNHAMVIVGVEIVDGKIKRWKIENSWGSDRGLKGYYVMSSTWFDRFVYQAVVMKKYLTPEEVKATLEEPTHLPPWDPMGTLAD